jgi:predicted transcriptional regulator
MNKGWILLHRKIYVSNDFKNELDRSIFIFLLARASYEPVTVVYRQKRIALNRGELLITYGDIASKFGISVQNVRTIIKNLKLTGTLTVSLTRGLMRISIEKYIKYQDIDSKKTTKLTGSLTNRRKKPKKLNNIYTSNIINMKKDKIDIKSSIPKLKSLNKTLQDNKDEFQRAFERGGQWEYEQLVKKRLADQNE